LERWATGGGRKPPKNIIPSKFPESLHDSISVRGVRAARNTDKVCIADEKALINYLKRLQLQAHLSIAEFVFRTNTHHYADESQDTL
jgi:hypothetical protein